MLVVRTRARNVPQLYGSVFECLLRMNHTSITCTCMQLGIARAARVLKSHAIYAYSPDSFTYSVS
jgi:hypothetical protein